MFYYRSYTKRKIMNSNTMAFFSLLYSLALVSSDTLITISGVVAISVVSLRPSLPTPTRATSLQATWSNGQAVQDYQNFLSSGKQEVDLTEDGPSVIVVPLSPTGEKLPMLARTLLQMSLGEDVVVSPQQDLPISLCNKKEEYPVYLCLPPYQLSNFLDNLPESYKVHADDFVFFSGGPEHGYIEDILKERGYCRERMTQVLISGLRCHSEANNNLIVTEDVKATLHCPGTDVTPSTDRLAGECAATGKWAGSIASRLERSSVFCQVDFYREWRRRMWERALYDAVFSLVGAVRDADQPTTMRDVATYYAEEVSEIVWEMSQLLRGWKAITLLYGFEERLLGIGESAVVDQSCLLIDKMYPFIWGIPVFLQSKTFAEYLHYAQSVKGLLSGIDLPGQGDGNYTSHMRQGNLRADGVI